MTKMTRSFAMTLSFLVLTAGCSDETAESVTEPETEVAVTETITDPDTEPIIPSVETITSDMMVYDYRYDAMDRGNYDYYDKKVVIDTDYYEENEYVRGDVIAYKKASDDSINLARIIALPGEKVEIESGQIYVNDKQLDTFYGSAHRLGLGLEELKNMLEEGDYGLLQSRENVESNINGFENTNVKETTVPENHLFIIGDDWFRTPFRGSLPAEKIVGHVLGYES